MNCLTRPRLNDSQWLFSHVLRGSIHHYAGLTVSLSVGRSVGPSHMLFSHFLIVLSIIMSIQSVIKSIQSVIKSIQSVIKKIQLHLVNFSLIFTL